MKKTIIFISLAVAMIACKKNTNEPTTPAKPDQPGDSLATKVISFENAVLDSNLVMDNVPYSEDILTFSNHYDTTYGAYWEDFAISAVYNDTNPSPYENLYGSITASAYEGKNFAVVFLGYYGLPTISAKQDFQPQSVYINNSTYCYYTLKDGNDYSKKFSDDDYFYITATGFTADSVETGHADFYLADFREGKSVIVRDWTLFDLSPLGTCRYIQFTFTSTDMGDWGMNTPGTAIIDKMSIKY